MGEHPSVVGESIMASGRFVQLKALEWVDANGVPRVWESAERTPHTDAVLILAKLSPSNRILLIRQYRPPARRELIEFPAGLVDPDETPAIAAARELREETGYVASSIAIYPAAYTTPGLSNETVHIALVEINENAPENVNPQTAFDAGEAIETILVPEQDLGMFYREELQRGSAFDSKVAVHILSRFPA